MPPFCCQIIGAEAYFFCPVKHFNEFNEITMSHSDVKKVFQFVDTMDAASLTACMTPDAIFRFSNMPPIKGSAAILPFLQDFFNSIKAIRHSDLEIFEMGNTIVTNGVVTYTRHSGTEYSCNFSNTFKMDGEFIAQYLIFVDNSKLYND